MALWKFALNCHDEPDFPPWSLSENCDGCCGWGFWLWAILVLVCWMDVAMELCAGQSQSGRAPLFVMREWNWLSEPPADCPFKACKSISSIQFTGRHVSYEHADTWYPSWGADGRLYSPFADGNVKGTNSWSGGDKAVVGHVIIEGDDPLSLTVVQPGTIPANPLP